MTRVDESLDLIERWQPVTNAFSQVWPEDARDAAEHAPEGPLRGVPVAVKDLFDVTGRETTGCSRAYAGNIAERDAELVVRLRNAGAVLVGKTNMHELAMGGTNQVSACGPTASPWDPSRITGGSSGGSAAAVATRSVTMALGTDTGGSIRNPSVLCGCWGLKPTYGRLPLDGVMPLAPSLDCPGPMAATAADLELLWRVLVESRTIEGELPRRVGLLGGFFGSHVHPDIRAAVAVVRKGLESLGVEVVEVDGSGIEFATESWPDLVCMEMIEAQPRLMELRDKLFPGTAGFVARGMNLTDDEKTVLRRRPNEAKEWFTRRFDGVELLLAPSAPYPAPRLDQEEVDVGNGETVDVHLGGASRFTRPVNMAGLPAIAVPAGRTLEGLPVGAQLIGRANDDAALLRIALELEKLGGAFLTQVPPPPPD